MSERLAWYYALAYILWASDFVLYNISLVVSIKYWLTTKFRLKPAHTQCELEYKNLSWVWGADRKICPRSLFCFTWFRRTMPNSDPKGRIFLSAPKSHDRFFFLHTFWSPSFDFNVGVAINESCWHPPYWNLISYVTWQWRQLPTSWRQS